MKKTKDGTGASAHATALASNLDRQAAVERAVPTVEETEAADRALNAKREQLRALQLELSAAERVLDDQRAARKDARRERLRQYVTKHPEVVDVLAPRHAEPDMQGSCARCLLEGLSTWDEGDGYLDLALCDAPGEKRL